MTQTDPDLFDMHDLVSLLRRQARVLWVVGVLCFGSAILFLVISPPIYTATTLLIFDPSPVNPLNPALRAARPGGQTTTQIASEVALLKSDLTALQTIQTLNLRDNAEFGPSPDLRAVIARRIGLTPSPLITVDQALNLTLSNVKRVISIERKSQSHVIAISARSKDPNLAAAVADTFAESHIHLQLRAKIKTATRVWDALHGQTAQAQHNLADAEDALNHFIDQRLGTLAKDSTDPEFLRLRGLLTTANTAHLQTGISLSTAQQALHQKDWPTLANTLGTETLSLMADQHAVLARKLGAASSVDDTDFELKAELLHLDLALGAQANQDIATLTSAVAGFEAEAGAYRLQLRDAAFNGWLAPLTLAKLYALQQQSNSAQHQYKILLSALDTAKTKAALQSSDLRIVSRALPPTQQNFPKPKLILGLTTVFALLAGLGAAVLNEHYRGGFTSEKQLNAYLPAKTTVSLPQIPPARPSRSVADLQVENPRSAFANSIRRLQISVDHIKPKTSGQGKVIMVTSTLMAEGKTSLALALGRAYALSGKKTLLIDADLRNPNLHRCLNQIPLLGLADMIRDPDKFVASNSLYTADPLSSAYAVLGQVTAEYSPENLLQSAGFAKLITKARATMDIVIIDTPPVMPAVDTAYVAPYVDAALFCVRYQKTTQHAFGLGYERLQGYLPNAVPILPVLNQQNRRDTEVYALDQGVIHAAKYA